VTGGLTAVYPLNEFTFAAESYSSAISIG